MRLKLTVDHGDVYGDPMRLPWFRQAFQQAILGHLQNVGRDGWQPEGPTDFASLNAAGAIATTHEGFFMPGRRYESVTLRLKRFVPAVG